MEIIEKGFGGKTPQRLKWKYAAKRFLKNFSVRRKRPRPAKQARPSVPDKI
jgi:hypothetical protein